VYEGGLTKVQRHGQGVYTAGGDGDGGGGGGGNFTGSWKNGRRDGGGTLTYATTTSSGSGSGGAGDSGRAVQDNGYMRVRYVKFTGTFSGGAPYKGVLQFRLPGDADDAPHHDFDGVFAGTGLGGGNAGEMVKGTVCSATLCMYEAGVCNGCM
jgi:hypothetical protein